MSEPLVASGDPAFRQACVEALHDVLHQYEPVHPDTVSVALDALLPVLVDYIRPHRWDKEYPESAAPGPCHGSTPDTFYAGVLHAAAVVRDLLPPKVRDESAKRSEVPNRSAVTTNEPGTP